MIKVAHIITRLEFGGAQGNTLYTAANLDRARFEPMLITGRGGILDQKAQQPPVYAESLVREISPLKDFLALLQLRAIFSRLKPEIVHTHSSKAGILGRLAAAAAGVPVIVHTFHGFGFHPYQNPLKRWFYILLEMLCARLTDALIFVSRSNMKTASANGIGRPEQYSMIRSGIKLGNYPARIDRAAKRAGLGIGEEDIMVLSLGNAKPQKNPEHFLEAAARLTDRHPRARFVFVGGGEYLEELKEKARARGLEEKCLFTGWRDDSAELLAAADIFAMTSLWEGLPRALVEALCTGLPCICYAADGVNDILRDGKNGFVIPPGDLDAFCDALSNLISDGELRGRMAAAAAGTDLGDFDIDLMVRQQEELYSRLLSEKGAGK